MIRRLVHFVIRLLISLRYRVRTRGLEDIARKGSRGILFLPNHPALIDPVIMLCVLERPFAPRPLADEKQVRSPALAALARMVRTVVIPDMRESRGEEDRRRTREALDGLARSLERGENILLYPAGRLMRSRKEDLGASSAVETLLRAAPGCRVVLARTKGLWGSRFSHASGRPSLFGRFWFFLGLVLANLVVFMPRREVVIEFHEPPDLPRDADRLVLNRYLEEFYNAVEERNTQVPDFFWQGQAPRQLPEPEPRRPRGDLADVPDGVRDLVLARLREMSGRKEIRPEELLARDLGLDSLALVDLMAWLEEEFGVPQGDMEGLATAGDCMLAACGQMVGGREVEMRPVSRAWARPAPHRPLEMPAGRSVAELFLQQARRRAGQVAVADQLSGEKTYRDLVTAILALSPFVRDLEEERVGIMLPPAVSAVVAWLTVMFCGKVPVMVNWTVGAGQVNYCLESVGVRRVITARALLKRLGGQGLDLDRVAARWLCLEDMAQEISLPAKLMALARSRLGLHGLERRPVARTAAILFTSGSEARPKAVPLSHANFLANLRDFTSMLTMYEDDRLLGMLPPFHSLGLAGTMILPLALGLRTVYSPNPTEPLQLARVAGAYGITMLIGTPTFISGILKAADRGQLASLRLAFTGAEKCPDHVYARMAAMCPGAVLCEGYGITECSPVVSVNRVEDPRPGTIGVLLPGMEMALVHPETRQPVAPGESGILLLRGPNVFDGYLNPGAKDPFVEHAGRRWYDSGDLVRQEDGVLVFTGRMKRFIKLGGEMISLPAIEEALLGAFVREEGDGPVLAVEATPSEEHPEVVLFTTTALAREAANQALRAAGLSPLHNIRRVVEVEEIPVLGTGKTDYKALKTMLGERAR